MNYTGALIFIIILIAILLGAIMLKGFFAWLIEQIPDFIRGKPKKNCDCDICRRQIKGIPLKDEKVLQDAKSR